MANRSVGIRRSAIAAGVLVAFIASLVLSALLGTVMLKTTIAQGTIPALISWVGTLSVAIGGAYAGRRAGVGGLFNGGLTGIGYVLISALFGYFLFPGALVLGILAKKLGVGFIVGAIGGTLGVNL